MTNVGYASPLETKRDAFMKSWIALLIGLAVLDAHADHDFNCMQQCFSQGYDRYYCAGICETRGIGGAGGGMLEQPGLPKNPAFEQMQRDRVRPPAPMPVADPKCMKECQNRGYGYMLCQDRCSYSLKDR
jgi:hypothetical protein